MTIEEAYKAIEKVVEKGTIFSVKVEFSNWMSRPEYEAYIITSLDTYEYNWYKSFNSFEDLVADILYRIENKIYFIPESKEI
jgi:hypothetical protein